MGNELKWLLKEGSGCTLESCAQVSLALTLFVCTCSDSAMPFYQLAYAITANGVCLHLLVPPLTQYWFFSASCLT